MIKLVDDTIGTKDRMALIEWLYQDPKLTKGHLTQEFEKNWSQWQNVLYSCFVNSGSSANLLMASALLESGRLKNKKIIVPAVSWATTVAPFIQLGYEPILCDCDPNDLGLNIHHFSSLVQEHRPAAVILVHVLGWANNMSAILEICKDNNVILLEDCCEAHGATYQDQKVGTYGLMSSFSYYYGHHMSTIEGGMVCTNDPEIRDLCLILRSHGWVRDLDPNSQKQYAEKYNIDDFNSLYFFIKPGFNIRSTDLNAFLGIRQLNNLSKNIEKRRENLKIYQDYLDNHVWTQKSTGCNPSPLAFGLIHKKKEQIVKELNRLNVECRPLICGSIARHPFWIEKYGSFSSLPNADKVHDFGLYLPCHQKLKPSDIKFICQAILDIL
tara:strand:+ start:8557 stop:9705 length:1149 start_codon:yes stop_codon:yes gene_type:complete